MCPDADDPLGLGAHASQVLQALARDPYVSSAALAAELDVTVRRVLPVLHELALRGLAQPGDAEDRMAWALTDDGWDVLREIRRTSKPRGARALLRRRRR